MGVSAIRSAVSIYANTIAGMEMVVSERIDDRDRWGSRRPAIEHPAYPLLSSAPNPETTAFRLRQTLMVHALTKGNAYAEIVRRVGNPVALYLLDPGGVEPIIGTDGRLFYSIDNGRDTLPARDVIHIANLSRDGVKGDSPIATFRRTIGLAVSQEEHQLGLVLNNATPNGFFKIARRLQDAEKAKLRSDAESINGGPFNAGRFGILDNGLEWVQTSFSPEDAQLLLSRNFSIAEVARIYNIPQHMLGLLEHATFSNIEHQDLQFYKYSLLPWLVLIEQELTAKLIAPKDRGRFSIKHDAGSLLRGDTASQLSQAKELFAMGCLSRNEVRARFGLAPVENGDTYHIPSNNLTAIGSDTGDGPQLDPDAPPMPSALGA